MNLGVETPGLGRTVRRFLAFQHSLMNLGVETNDHDAARSGGRVVSAFSDESWGGDHSVRRGAP